MTHCASEEKTVPFVGSSCSLQNAATLGTWDAAVVGAGVAGTSIAQRLARRGYRVLLIEKKKFPRNKVCGSCLNLRSLQYLNEAGVSNTLVQLGALELDTISLFAGTHHAHISLPGGMAVSRSVLDTTLAQAAKTAGATLLLDTTASLDRDTRGEFRRILLRCGSDTAGITARLVIVADGLAGKFMQEEGGSLPKVAPNGHIGLGAIRSGGGDTLPRGRIHMHCGEEGYVGLVQIENGDLAIAAAVQSRAVRTAGGAAPCVERMLRNANQNLPVGLENLQWQGTPVLTRRPGHTVAHRVVALGDAAGYVEPFTGEGMTWAMEAASKLDLHLSTLMLSQWDMGAQRWERVYRRHMYRKRLLCRGLTTALRFPRLTVASVGILGARPALSNPIISALNHIARS